MSIPLPTRQKSPNRFPGTDDATGWPKEPKHPCAKGPELCHLALVATPSECCYQPPACPFYSRYPHQVQDAFSWIPTKVSKPGPDQGKLI